MAKKPAKYDKLKSIKSVARKRVGPPAASRPLSQTATRDKPKHKKPISEAVD